MLIVVFFFFLEHTRFFREYTSIAWLVRVNHKHAVACCIVVLSIQSGEFSRGGWFSLLLFGYYFFLLLFWLLLCFWLLALYKLQANISF